MNRLLDSIEHGEAYLLLIPVYALLLGGERLWYFLRHPDAWDDGDSIANIAITAGHLLIELAFGAIFPVAVFALLNEYVSPWTLGFGAFGWVAAFLLHDLVWYIDHRLSHGVSLFWAFHQVHHSSRQYNTTVASRGFLLDRLYLTRPLFYLLPLLGVTPLHFVALTICTSVWGIVQHTRVIGRVPILDSFLATPSNHRVHHGADDDYLDRNYGEVLIIWDRLLGTYTAEREEPTYGVVGRTIGNNPLAIQVDGLAWLAERLQNAPSLNDKLRALAYPPGWKPSGTRRISDADPEKISERNIRRINARSRP